MKPYLSFALALSAFVATPAMAGTTIFTGDTTGGPTFNRPVSGTPPTGLSGVGTAVRYVVTPFTVSATGAYSFLNESRYDNYLGIHAGSFNPLNALENAVAYDDDFAGLNSGFAGLNLMAGTSYFAITSGFQNSDFGAYTLTVSGLGDITGETVAAVPEPGIWAMMILGFGFVGSMLRRRKLGFALAA